MKGRSSPYTLLISMEMDYYVITAEENIVYFVLTVH